MNSSQNPLNQPPEYLVQSKEMEVEYGMLDFALQMLAAIGVCALPFIFMGYVRSRVRHALKANTRAH